MSLKQPDDIRKAVRIRYDSRRRDWLDGAGDWPLSLPLGVPTEQEAVANRAAVRAWVAAWTAWTGPGTLTWVDRRWAGSSHRLPASLQLSCAEDCARLVGDGKRWSLAAARHAELAARWPVLAAAGASRHFDVLADYSADDYQRLVRLLGWLEAHPKSGHYLRHLPVEGLDTKWFKDRKGLVEDLVRRILPPSEAVDLYSLCGLARHPQRLRMRVLCPELRLLTGGLGDIHGTVDDLAKLAWRPRCVLVVENQETGVALPLLDGVVAFQELGNAVGLLGALPWLHATPVLYWGDLDTHGFAILHQARLALPHVQSILMDAPTLLAHLAMCVDEPRQHPSVTLAQLNATESEVYAGLRQGRWGPRLRLEQERIGWGYAMARIAQALGELAAGERQAQAAATR